MSKILRILRHLALSNWKVRRDFPHKTLSAIEHAIKLSELQHDGEIRFVVEGGLSGAPLYRGQPVRERAIDIFSQVRMWDTEHRNGVLIYLLVADRAVEIVSDRGIHGRVDGREWERICTQMETAFHERRFEHGVLEGIAAVSEHLVRHFPSSGANRNELPNKVVLL